MSFYGLFYNGIAITPNTYLSAWFVNFIAALPLNFLIVEPIARFILSSFQKPFTGEEVEDFQDDDEIPTIYLSQFCKLLIFEIHFLLGYNGYK
ncbi:membrane protein [Streptococcus pneumoniae]|nr:membrane protein [Streptococcus pneumoniae]